MPTSITSILPILYVILSFSAVILLSMYEFFITSELVVPEVARKLERLPEIVNQGFILHSRIVPKRHTSVRETLEADFSRWNISDKLNISVKEMAKNEIDLVKMFAKSRPKFAMIFRGLPSMGILHRRMVAELELKGRYNCHLVTNVAHKRTIYDNFINPIGPRCKQILDTLRESGFYIVWEKWNELAGDVWFAGKVRGTNLTVVQVKADYISFRNLLSFQIVFVVILIVAGIVWVVEKVIGKSTTVVNINSSWFPK